MSKRLALGVSYRGGAYHGWQSQPDGCTVQDQVEKALSTFADCAVSTVCAGRTDTGVHGINQVVHLDAPVEREPSSWVRGSNRYLPGDIALQWCQSVADDFHARNSARGRRYRFVILESPVRPALESGVCGWVFAPLDGTAMQRAASLLLGEHDFSSFRAAGCQAKSPVKTLHELRVDALQGMIRFDFSADAFLHHMIRNLVGALVHVGAGRCDEAWVGELLAARDRRLAPPTFAADGLYFTGADYDARHALPPTRREVTLTA